MRPAYKSATRMTAEQLDALDKRESVRCSVCAQFHFTWQKGCLSCHLLPSNEAIIETRQCDECRNYFNVKPSNKCQRYCSRACAAKIANRADGHTSDGYRPLGSRDVARTRHIANVIKTHGSYGLREW
jgi:hypothetical protein